MTDLFFADFLSRATTDRFAAAIAVNISGVDEVDAGIDCRVQSPQ